MAEKIYSEYLMDWLSPLTKGERRHVRKAARKLAGLGERLGDVDPRCCSPVRPCGVGFTYAVSAYFPEEDVPGEGYTSQTFRGLRFTKEIEFLSVEEFYLRNPGAPVFAAAKAGECYREE